MRYIFFLLLAACSLSSRNPKDNPRPEKQPVKRTAAEKKALWQKQADTIQVAFGNSSTRYEADVPPPGATTKSWEITAWKGERVHTQVLIWGRKAEPGLLVVATALTNEKGEMIPLENIFTGQVKPVWTDEYRDGCGYRTSTDFDSSQVADLIDTKTKFFRMSPDSLVAVWVSIQVGAETPAGLYNGYVVVNGSKPHILPVSVKVLDRALPAPAAWKYQLDLWQHPAAIARVQKLKLWSDEHFKAMKPYYQMLAAAGQKAITASIVNEPWGHQTYDDYPSLVKWTKKKDGSWVFDYSLFDKYVQFTMDCGINKWIHCYSMVPWKIAFSYYDETIGRDTVFTDGIGTAEYNRFWTVMLSDFTKHLKEKGWFEKTAISMDERPMAAMKAVIELLKKIDDKWKVTLAGGYHAEVEADIFDYCLASAEHFPPDVLARRKQEGKLSTWYTCCSEKFPNGFTFSPPDEHVWMGWYTAAKGLDGYLRWAFNSWPQNPNTDSRFTAWPGGDTYQVYPGPLTSIRFEKMVEGVQDFEKIQFLKKFYAEKKMQKELAELETVLAGFNIPSLATTPASKQLEKAKLLLNK
ncbi:MAG TPA: DUF4091 domain-containing protein [Flavihumibacter sp.]|nr:DUF4091 domain-containing protein [Flavihumibacter sp.]HQD08822.1 DUF4091 domain-containing protein [Flavihumibacter sp.]